jgi:hypothetical protein
VQQKKPEGKQMMMQMYPTNKQKKREKIEVKSLLRKLLRRLSHPC